MTKVIVVKNSDGSCAIIHPAKEMFDPQSKTRGLLASKGITFNSDEEVMQYIINKDVPKGQAYRVTDKANLPQDRTFRNAWTDQGLTETVDVDVKKAQEIHKDKLRELRTPKLAALDVEYMQALEKGTSTTEIVAKKQALRDVTKTKLPTDLEKLKNHIPDCLEDE